MADSNQNTSNPLGQTANPQGVLPDAAGRPVPLVDRDFAGGGEGPCPLWDGHIIDATFPLVWNVPAESSLPPSRELAVSRRALLSSRTNQAVMSFSCLLDERSMSSGGSIQAVRQSSLAVVR